MRRVIAFVLVLLLCMSFVACTNQETTEQSSTSKVEVDLTGKTIIWNGDSICAGRTGTSNWADRIAEKNKMEYKNYAIGGGTIAEDLPPMKSGNKRHSVSATLDKMYQEYPNADYVIIEGGTNDADLLGNALNGATGTKLGTVDPQDFSGNYDRTTFCGALESVFYRAKQYWGDKKIAYIVAQKMSEDKDIPTFNNRRLYFDKAVEICKKWDIPYLDLWNGCDLDPFLPEMYDSTKSTSQNLKENTGYYIDGQQLTARGYDVTADIIDAWLKTL